MINALWSEEEVSEIRDDMLRTGGDTHIVAELHACREMELLPALHSKDLERIRQEVISKAVVSGKARSSARLRAYVVSALLNGISTVEGIAQDFGVPQKTVLSWYCRGFQEAKNV